MKSNEKFTQRAELAIEKAGFAAASGEFLEDGISHIKMTFRIK